MAELFHHVYSFQMSIWDCERGNYQIAHNVAFVVVLFCSGSYRKPKLTEHNHDFHVFHMKLKRSSPDCSPFTKVRNKPYRLREKSCRLNCFSSSHANNFIQLPYMMFQCEIFKNWVLTALADRSWQAFLVLKKYGWMNFLWMNLQVIRGFFQRQIRISAAEQTLFSLVLWSNHLISSIITLILVTFLLYTEHTSKISWYWRDRSQLCHTLTLKLTHTPLSQHTTNALKLTSV